jgi:hypothetical protein
LYDTERIDSDVTNFASQTTGKVNRISECLRKLIDGNTLTELLDAPLLQFKNCAFPQQWLRVTYTSSSFGGFLQSPQDGLALDELAGRVSLTQTQHQDQLAVMATNGPQHWATAIRMVIYTIVDPAFRYFEHLVGRRIAREWGMEQTIISIP